MHTLDLVVLAAEWGSPDRPVVLAVTHPELFAGTVAENIARFDPEASAVPARRERRKVSEFGPCRYTTSTAAP